MWRRNRNSEQVSNGLYYGGTTLEECQKMIHKSLQTPKVKFLMEEMKKAGCPISRYFIKPVRCKQPASGFYASGKGILVCSNYLRFQDEVNQVVTHELIHAYDECRAANLNWRNCVHQACSEIRANNLSGDCHYMRELLRGHINLTKFRGHQPDCVRRRATNSVRSNPSCTSEYMADMAVKAAWETCYNDTKPFDKAP